MSQMMHKLLRDILETTGGDHRRSVSAAAFARPNDANAYAIGDLVTNSTIAGNITALPFAVARPARSATPVDPATGAQAIFSGVIRRARLVKSSTTVANAQFRLHLFADGPPGAINGDNGVFTPIDIDVVKSRANHNVRAIAAELLPNGREECGYWRTGSIADEPGQSLAVTLTGPDQGMWCDHACRSTREGGGDIIQLVEQAAFRGDRGQAIAWLKSRLGLDGLDPGRLRKLQAEAAAEPRPAGPRGGRGARAQAPGARHVASRASRSAARRSSSICAAGASISACWADARLPRLRPRALLQGSGAQAAGDAGGGGRPDRAAHRDAPHLARAGRPRRLDQGRPRGAEEGARPVHGRVHPAVEGHGGRQEHGRAPPGPTSGRAKGSRTASAAMAKPELRVVAAVTLGNLGAIELPDQVGRFVIIGQRDTHRKTLEALERAIGAQQERGREVWLTPPPAGGFKDVNEALQAA
jgi:hypothetical protein